MLDLNRQMTYICGKFPDMDPENVINEALAVYKTTDNYDFSAFIAGVRSGIEYFFFQRLVKESPFSLQDWSHFLHLSDRTIQRYKKDNKPFDQVSTEKIFEIALLYKYGEDVFGDKRIFKNWLNDEILAFGRKRPIDFMDTSMGIRMIRNELGRIEHGIFA